MAPCDAVAGGRHRPIRNRDFAVKINRTAALIATLVGATYALPALARDEIRIVGSSTVYPFATVVAERFGRTTNFPTPVIESTGTGGGLKLFCAGAGQSTPDISNASRRIKPSEIANCKANGVDEIVEVKIGYDGIVIANKIDAPQFKLSLRDIYLALAKQVPAGDGGFIDNPNVTWSDVNPDLPNIRIEVLGPPPTSGTRDAFDELAMEGGCKTFPSIEALKKSDGAAYKKVCQSLREDGKYVEAGENDNLIVQKLVANPDALGVFGFSYLDQNMDKLKASIIEGVGASFDNISSGDYPISRPLFFYIKKSHMDMVPGLKQYVTEFMSDRAIGEEGYLSDRGLIPMGTEERKEWQQKTENLQPIALK